MGFWDKHLGGSTPPAQQPTQPPAYPAPPTNPQQFQQPQPWQQPPPTPEQEAQPESLSEALQSTPTTVPQKAVANRTETGRCPACGSVNWFTGAATGTPVKPHCYDCGFPNVQAGSGMGALASVKASGPAVPAQQPNTPNPDPTGF